MQLLTMRTKQNYHETCTKKQKDRSHSEKEESELTENCGSKVNNSWIIDSSDKESSNKNKKVSRSKCK